MSLYFDTETILNGSSAGKIKQLTGIRFLDGATLCLSGNVSFGHEIEIKGQCSLKDGNVVDSGVALSNVVAGSGNHFRRHSILENAVVGSDNIFGPFCFIRDRCKINDRCILGAHVETARAQFENDVKVSHRAFVADAYIGSQTTIGASVVFCNWDGLRHRETSVGSGVTVGSGTQLVAPLTIGQNVVIGAGSVVTKNLADNTKFLQKRDACPTGF